MSWGVTFDPSRLSLCTRRIPQADGLRQERTVAAVLRRLDERPGLVLADEVGMGKTFVALAVAACAAWSKPEADPVVVMVPPSLKHKWPRDFGVFMAECVREGASPLACRHAASGIELLKLLDDPPHRRAHVIFLAHGALHRSLQDPWSKLAILEQALRAPELAAQRAGFPRFAADVLRIASTHRDPELFRELLATPVEAWRGVLARHDKDPGDEPVPEALLKSLHERPDLEDLPRALRDVPLRDSKYLDERLQSLRHALGAAFQTIWRDALRRLRFRSPLLVLDEAHHARNPATRLASLFADEDAQADADQLEGALSGCFERMLFLTATPFQLGHRELLAVLERFVAVRWDDGSLPMTKAAFREELDLLGRALDEYHVASTHLRDAWARQSAPSVEREAEAHRAAGAAREALRHAESRLRPWIIRHLRRRTLAADDRQRREVRFGASIVPGREDRHDGIEVSADAVLPFLLAARAESVLARDRRLRGLSTQGAATFGEGLASSYEAFRETRRSLSSGGSRALLEEAAEDGHGEISAQARWYVEQMSRALPDESSLGRHPKVSATVARVLDLWKRGEKVVVFCHWRATGEALRRHVSAALSDYLRQEAHLAFACPMEEVDRRLENVRERFDESRPIGRRLTALLDELLSDQPALPAADATALRAIVRRFVREPSFLVRWFELEAPDDVAAFERAYRERTDESGLTLHAKLERFLQFLSADRTAAERSELIEALRTISVASRSDKLPNVRLANGGVAEETRRHLLLAFNAPFLPEVLIASSVLAEGVDLHLDCRNVIHHDLSWNPSTIEQRTGRVDRLGCKAERVGRPIRVFLPYVAATQDEKMFRVVRERESWFNVLMTSETGCAETAGLPLPVEIAESLTMKLGVEGE